MPADLVPARLPDVDYSDEWAALVQLPGTRPMAPGAGGAVAFASHSVAFRLPLAGRWADRLPITCQVRENPAGAQHPSVPKEQPPR